MIDAKTVIIIVLSIFLALMYFAYSGAAKVASDCINSKDDV